MKLGLTTKSIGASPPWLDSTEGVRFLTGGVTIDSAKTRADSAAKKIVKSGTPVGKAGAKYRRSPVTALAAAAAATDTFIDVDDAGAFVPGDVIDVNGTSATIAAAGIAIGGGAGGSDRITLTAAVGAAKAVDDVVRATDGSETAVGLLWEELDVTDGDAHGGAIDHGRVRTAALPVTLHADAIASLKGVGITFRA
jgi:hypothetical protein